MVARPDPISSEVIRASFTKEIDFFKRAGIDYVDTAAALNEPNYFNEPPRRTGWLVAGLALLAAILIVGTVLVVRQVSKKDGGPVEQVFPLPDVRKPLDEAQKTLQDLGLVPIAQPQYSDTAKVNDVWAQSPVPGDLVKKGDKVTLTYNPGKGTVALPSLVGLPKADAVAKLTTLGLKSAFVDQESDTIPVDQVVAQDPPASDVAPGSKVTLTVSVGKGKIEVINVLNLDLATASNQLGAKGFTITTETKSDETIAAGKVISTDPAPGTTVDKGTTVKLVISDGPPKVVVPNVEGLSLDDAVTKLTGSFQWSMKTTDVPYGDSRDGKVISQSPAAGAQVPKGTTVTLLVGKALPQPTTLPATTTSTTIAKTTTTAPAPTTSTTKP